MLIVSDAKDSLMDVKLRAMVLGLPGSGKTYFASTCPKVYYIGLSHGEADTFKVQPKLKNNIVKIAELVPGNTADLRTMFGDLDKGIENGLIHKVINEAKDLYAKGEIETILIDWKYVVNEMFDLARMKRTPTEDIVCTDVMCKLGVIDD